MQNIIGVYSEVNIFIDFHGFSDCDTPNITYFKFLNLNFAVEVIFSNQLAKLNILHFINISHFGETLKFIKCLTVAGGSRCDVLVL